jgi:Zn-dependent M28 family amino/carboxypeptidase
MLTLAGLDLDKLRKKAQNRDFTPVKTGLKIDLELNSELKRFNSPNVIGKVQGTDIKLSNEYVVYSAHWDHLGIGEPDARGDKIYNGAYDNASGVSTVLGIAEVLAKLPKLQRPRRSVLFLFPTAEEQGLLGAEYYARNPLVPISKTAANINLDGVNIFGKVSDFMALGAERSTLISPIHDAAAERKMTLKTDSRPEQGFFFRSDHFPFAKAGVPSVSLQHGDTFITPLSNEAAGFARDYTAKYYHQVSDEYRDWWDVSAMIQEAELALAIGFKVANAWEMPHYNESDEFAAADKHRATK